MSVVVPTRARVQGRDWPMTSLTGVGKKVKREAEVAVEEVGPVVGVLLPHRLLFVEAEQGLERVDGLGVELPLVAAEEEPGWGRPA